nr:hypothetical protein [uncultured Pseudodesulfovibrio sp.]
MAAPSGIFAFVGPLLSGLAGATGIATLGAGGTTLTTDGLGALGDKNESDPFKATKETAKAVAGAAAINAGIGATAASGAGIAKAVPAAAAAAPTIIRQGKEATKAVAGKGKAALKAGVEWAKANPQRTEKVPRIANDILNDSLPPETEEGKIIVTGKNVAKKMLDALLSNKDSLNEVSRKKESKRTHVAWWMR